MSFLSFLLPKKNPAAVFTEINFKLREKTKGDAERYYAQNKQRLFAALNAVLPNDDETDPSVKQEAYALFLLRTEVILEKLDPETERKVSPKIDPQIKEDFLENQLASMRKAFLELAKIDPLQAFSSAIPAECYEDVMIEALPDIAQGEDPELYFKCLDNVRFSRWSNSSRLFDELLQKAEPHTYVALANMLEKDPVRFVQGYGYDGYLSYIYAPEIRVQFVMEHDEKLANAYRQVRETQISKPGMTFGDYNPLECDVLASLQEKTAQVPIKVGYPSQLKSFEKELIADRLRAAFRAVADPDRPDLGDILTSVFEISQGPVVVHSVGSGLKGDLTRVLQIPNPDCAPDAGDEDRGVNSRYLWVVNKDYTVLAAAFSAADIHNYLSVQRERSPIDLITAEEFAEFSGYKPSIPQ